MVAQGLLEKEKQQDILELIENVGVGNYIPKQEVSFSIDIISKNYIGSIPTMKAAAVLGLNKIQRVGAGATLGPVFIKSVK